MKNNWKFVDDDDDNDDDDDGGGDDDDDDDDDDVDDDDDDDDDDEEDPWNHNKMKNTLMIYLFWSTLFWCSLMFFLVRSY